MFIKRFLPKLLLLSLFFISTNFLTAQTLLTGFTLTSIGSGWTQPAGTTFNSTGTKLFVWEKAGKVFVCNWDGSAYVKQSTAVLDISPEVGNWRDHGLLGFALDPNFDVNGLIYCMYVVDRHYLLNFGTGSYNSNTNTYNAATIGRITRYQTAMSGGNLLVIPATRTILLGETKTTGMPVLYESHGVGSLAFASDGTLLASCGDGASYDTPDVGSGTGGGPPFSYYSQALTDGIISTKENVGAFRSQLIDCLSGKILRLDPTNGNGVSSNPFYDAAFPRAARSRVWTLGLRNPFRFSIKPGTGSTNPATGDIGEIYVSDVGWSEFEELTIVKEKGTNCGWPLYEGINYQDTYYGYQIANKDQPNPLFGTGGCTQQYFYFTDLIKQATYNENTTLYNPCNNSVQIAGSVNNPRFVNRLPVLDFKHGIDSPRVAVFNGSNLTIQRIGSPASGVTGAIFRGNATTNGCWYTGSLFPPAYNNTFFMGDYGGGWIKDLSIQFTDKLQSVTGFIPDYGNIIHLVQNPLDGSLICTDIVGQTVKQIGFGGNQPPVVKMTSDKKYGPGPLTVTFTGNASYDPDGTISTYSWNFGDGSALSTVANPPAHVFSSGNSNPKKFVIKLTVKDNGNATSVDSIIISINNTPPNVTIFSPVNNSTYKVGVDTAYTLQAVVTDAEHAPNQLKYAWETALRHNSHQHTEPIDTNKLSSVLISRLGCNGDTYYWFVKLTVTDADGLSSVDSSKIFPLCVPLPLKLNSFTVTGHGNTNLLNWTTSEELNLKNFEIERSYDGINFQSIGSVNPHTGSTSGSYEFRDDNFLDGDIYYRLKMVDKDDNFAHSFIVHIYTGTKANTDLIISPNPFKNNFLFGAVFTNAGKVTIRIIDTKGTVVKVIKKQVNIGFNSFMIDKLENISKGVYFLELIQGTDIRKAKLIKQN